MAVTRKRQKMRRVQISITDEQYQKAKRLAEKRQASLSEVFRTGLECVDARTEEEDREYFEKMWSIVGKLKGADPHGSQNVDEVVYDQDPHR